MSEDKDAADLPGNLLKLRHPIEGEMEFRKKLYPNVSSVTEEKLKCSICMKEILHVILLKEKAYKHKFLQVLVCKSCLNFYGDGDFSLDEDGDEKYCRWCGQGGHLYLCEKCPTAFCKKCVRQNLDKEAIASTKRDDWRCYFCDPKPLFKLRAQTWAVEEHLANVKRKAKEKSLKKAMAASTPKSSTSKHVMKTMPDLEGNSDLDLGKHVDLVTPILESTFDELCNHYAESLELLRQYRADVPKFSVTCNLKSITDNIKKVLDASRAEFWAAENRLVDKITRLSLELSKLTQNGDDPTGGPDNIVENPKSRKKPANGEDQLVQNGDEETSGRVNSLSADMFESSAGPEEKNDRAEVAPSTTDIPATDSPRPILRLKPLAELIDPSKAKAFASSTPKTVKKEPKRESVKSPAANMFPKITESYCVISDDEDLFPKNEPVRTTVLNMSSSQKMVRNPKTLLRKPKADAAAKNDALTGKAKNGESDKSPLPNSQENLEKSKSDIGDECDPVDKPSSDKSGKSAESSQPTSVKLNSPEQETSLPEQETSLPEHSEKANTDDDSDAKVGDPGDKHDSGSRSDSSTSSSDPLSDKSGDLPKNKKSQSNEKSNQGKKTPSRKDKRSSKSLFSDSDDDLDEVSSDGSDLSDLLRRKGPKEKSKKDKKSVKKSSEKTKKAAKESSENDSEYDIRKLCNLKSLGPKRTYSSTSSVKSSSGDDSEKQPAKQSKKKSKSEKEGLEDFYDPEDKEERENKTDEEEVEDFQNSLRQQLFFCSGSGLDQDLKASILNMSSSEEEEEKGSDSDEVGKVGDKKNLTLSASKKKSKDSERPTKRYHKDKLLSMKLDSDTEDELDEMAEKYQKKRLAEKEEKKNKKSSSEEDTPVVKPKPKAASKKKPMKKFFSDSESLPEDLGSESDSKEKKSVKSSDEDSDKDVSKKKKKKKKATSTSGSDSSETFKTPSKKRRRIKRHSDSSSDSGNDKSVNDSGNKGRKNIRKVLKEDDLKQTTQAALKSEQERKKRILEKQQLYNSMVVKETAAHKELTELVLDFDPKTKEKLLVVNEDLVKKLKPHQAEGVKFMWDCCFETVEMAKKKDGSGCILAHCMGLGKSLQVVTLVHTVLTNPEIGVRTVLVVAPLSTVLNWVNEFDKWLKDVGSGEDVEVFHMSKTLAAHRIGVLKEWKRVGGVLILGYNLLRTLTNPTGRIKPSIRKVYQETLVDPGPDIVICDEGHILKNEKTAISACMSKLKTKRRIVLTGTPLQNNLVEYHCMVQFVKPNLLGTKKEFTNRFVNPIQNGQFEDSTAHDVKVMKRRAHVLHSMLDGLVQRKDYHVLTPYLPPKYEYVIHLKLSDAQVKLYRHYLMNVVQQANNPDSDVPVPKGRRLFVDFQNLMWICLHPRSLLMKSVKDEKKAEMEELEEDSEGSLKDFIADGSDTSSSSDFKSSDSEKTSSSVKSDSNGKKPRRGRKTRAQGSASEPEEEPAAPQKQWWSDIIDESDFEDIQKSSKLYLFFTILKFCEEIGDKLLLFSQSLYTLDLIEYFLEKVDSETQKPEEERHPGIKGFEGSWAKGLDYFRLDGSSACDNRESWCKHFNRPENTRARLFLISTRAGGLGINLTGANRVIIFDASWNPSFDVQSLFRVYRFGQDKPCYIYRFLSKGTMEEKIYERQVAKLSTSLRVIDEHQIDRHFTHSALAELYTFDPEGSELQGTPILPKDRLMAELIQSHKDIILSYHQHDSLLENQEDQELTEEERKAAWTEFDNEKNQRPVVFNQMNPNPANILAILIDLKTKMSWQNPTFTEEQLVQATMEIFKKFADYSIFAPFVPTLTNQLLQISKNQQSQIQGPGGPLVPQFPQMSFPTFRYPTFNNAGAGNTAATGVPGPSAQMFRGQMAGQFGPVPHNLAANPKAMGQNPLALNPKHLQAQQNASKSTANNGTSSQPIEID